MKKAQIVLILVLLLSFLTVVFASTTGYRLDDLGIVVLVPDEYYVFTREVETNDPRLKPIGMTKDELVKQMVDNNIYLTAIAKNFGFEINITMDANKSPDFDTIDDATLSSLSSALKSTFEKTGFTVGKYSIYNHTQTKFIKMYHSTIEHGQTTYCLQYYTALDKMGINVVMRSYEGPITSEKDSLIESIVKSISFYKHVSQKETGAHTYPNSTVHSSPAKNSVDDLLAQYSFGNIIISLIITILIYTVPIVVYRYAIKKEPVSTKAGVWITIIYAFFAIIVMVMIKSAISGNGAVGGAIIFWSFINYRILTKETEKDNDKNNQIEEVTNDSAPFYKAARSAEIDLQNQSIRYTEEYHTQANRNSANSVNEMPNEFSSQEKNDNADSQVNSERYKPVIIYSASATDEKRVKDAGYFCKRCGAAISSDSVFCRKCGARIKWE